MKLLRFAPYNRELVIFERWRVPYAPSYGWRRVMQDLFSEDAAPDRPEWPVGTAIIVTNPDSGFTGQRGTVDAVYTNSPAARASGCPILDVTLADGQHIIVAANSVEFLLE